MFLLDVFEILSETVNFNHQIPWQVNVFEGLFWDPIGALNRGQICGWNIFEYSSWDSPLRE